MKAKLVKKEYNNKKGPARTCFKGGFALLFSVLVASLLLTIGLSIFNIALKELSISTATRQSIHAFYAADSGREYARYRDLSTGDFPDIRSLLSSAPIEQSSTTDLSLISGDDSGPNFTVTVKKTRSAASSTTDKVTTEITSQGYDVKGGDRVERAIFQTY